LLRPLLLAVLECNRRGDEGEPQYEHQQERLRDLSIAHRISPPTKVLCKVRSRRDGRGLRGGPFHFWPRGTEIWIARPFHWTRHPSRGFLPVSPYRAVAQSVGPARCRAGRQRGDRGPLRQGQPGDPEPNANPGRRDPVVKPATLGGAVATRIPALAPRASG